MVEVDIPSQTVLVNDKIMSVKTNKDKSERLEFYSAQNEVLLTYVRKILFILYYIVFAIMAITLFMKRQQFSLLFVGVLLAFFGIFPYIVDYVATYAYYRWLDIMHYFYAGNVAYLYQSDKDQVGKIKMPEATSFATCTGNTCCPDGTTYNGSTCVLNGCVGADCCPDGTTYNTNFKICVPNVVPFGITNADATWKPFMKSDNTLEWKANDCSESKPYDPIILDCTP